MTTKIPDDISTILKTAISNDKDRERVLLYMESLQSEILKLGGTLPSSSSGKEDVSTDTDAAADNNDSSMPMPPMYVSGEDYDAAANFKQQAADAKGSGDYEKALEYYNSAIQAAPPSALLYANRALVLQKLGHYKAAEKDCNCALEQNPDSAKALKVRGQLRYAQQKWELALSDLNQAQTIDFDPDLVDTLKELTKKRIEQEQKEAQERIQEENKLRHRAEEIKKAQAEAKKREARERSSGGGGMPGGMGGMPGGMGGMSGMGGMPGGADGMSGMMEMLKEDPELQEAMKNPKVVAAFSEIMNGPGGPMGLMSNPAKLQELMADPDVGPVLNKLMSKFMGGDAGGMGGMPGAGGGAASGGSDDGIPDLGDLPDIE